MAESIIVKAAVVFETVVDVPLRITQEKFDALSDETKLVLIETSINETTAKRNALFVGVELVDEQQVLAIDEPEPEQAPTKSE